MAPYPGGENYLYTRYLQRNLQKNGFVVFLFDLRGFGESDDPVSLLDLKSVSDLQDVFSAYNYFTELEMVDAARVSLVGYSYGGGLAMRAVAKGINARKVVSIGPPRRVTERSALDLPSSMKRYSHDRKLKSLMPVGVYKEFLHHHNIDGILSYYMTPLHKPIFLIDGKLESKKDRQYLNDYFETISIPKKYSTIENTSHYFNTLHLFGSRILLYDQERIDYVINMIIESLEK